MDTTDKANLEATHEGAHTDFEQKLNSQIADIMGELDTIAKESHPENRIKALSAKLRHLEARRHHEFLATQELAVRERMADDIHDISVSCTLWLRKQQEIQPAPGHATTQLRAMGVRIEASGPDDDPNYQRIVKTIEDISVEMVALKRATIQHDLVEGELDRAHDRKMEEEGRKPSES